MAKILVSLMSDQTAPNLFLILDKQFEGIDQYIFITTIEMERKARSNNLIKAAKLNPVFCHKVEVVADDMEDVSMKLHDLGLEEAQHEFFINLTGGTKVMSLAVFDYFKEGKLTAKMFYLHIGRQAYWQVYPRTEFKRMPLLSLIDLASYLTSYGIRFGDKPGRNDLFKSEEYTQFYLKRYLDQALRYTEEGMTLGEFIGSIRDAYNKVRNKKKAVSFSKIKLQEVGKFLSELKFDIQKEGEILPREAEYLIGGWWEEWVYQKIKTQLDLEDTSIAMNIRLLWPDKETQSPKNELDILFMYENKIYLVECKARLSHNYHKIKKWFDPTVYMLRALRREFGLNVRTAIITLASLEDRKDSRMENFQDRAQDLNIILIDQKDILDAPDTWVNKIIEY